MSSRSRFPFSEQGSGQSQPADGDVHQPSAAGGPPSRVIPKLLAVWICGLAFLLAATPARNSDLWLHLASGRTLSAGRLPDGTDPFSFTTKGVYWVNHTWLSDRLFYLLYQTNILDEGSILVLAKAILTALLAGLLLCFHRPREGAGTLSFTSLLALLALGPWLLLRTTLLSVFCVVLTLYLLERPKLLEGQAAAKARRQRWLLVPLFSVWANLDGWFLLGPLFVGLYAVGALLPRARWSDFRALGMLTLAGLAGCLITPYHYRIFAWPTLLGLTHTEQALQNDPLGQNLVLSSFGARFAASTAFRSPGAWAYYCLLGTSAVSFILTRRTLQGGRFLTWLLLAALSIYQASTIPFFAVVAAPFLALNVQEWRRSRPLSERQQRLRTAALRFGVLLGPVLMVLAWPGWLQPAPYQPRSLRVEPDGSLVRLAEQLNRWHAEGRFQPDRFAFTFSPEVANHLAWFCSAEKGFLDSRWELFDRVVDDYVRMRRHLLEEDGTDAGEELVSLLTSYRIDRILLYDPDWERNTRAYRRLFASAPEWELLAVEGGATLFRRSGSAPTVEAFDYRRAAYHPAPDQHAPPPPRPPRPPGWFDAFLHRPEIRPADREEARLHLLSFDLLAQQQLHRWLVFQNAWSAGLIGCGSERESAGTACVLALRLYLNPPLPVPAPEPLLLAVRAARRALAVNPDDARAFLLLGEAYLRLAQQTSELSWETMLPEFARLRQAQSLTVLEQAVLLQPALAQAHDLLAQIYSAQGQLDRCLDHCRAQMHIAERSAQRRGVNASQDGESLAALRASVENLETVVHQAEKTYQANLAGKTEPSKVLMRAELAARNGLARKALQLMLESSPAIFGRSGVEYELDLMIKAGQGYQIRDWLEPDYEAQIDFDKFHWLKARAAASCGAYEEADAELDRGSEPLRRIVRPPKVLLPVRVGAALHVAQAALARPLPFEGVAGISSACRIQFELLDPLRLPARLLRQEADRQVLRGLLALESGAVEAAQQHFRAALDVWRSDGAAENGAGLDFPARPIAQEMLRRLQE